MPDTRKIESYLDGIRDGLRELNSHMRAQNEILCRVHYAKLPKRLIRQYAPDLEIFKQNHDFRNVPEPKFDNRSVIYGTRRRPKTQD